jgi:steroid delta-isomerase-like uncharacterized protein
VSTEENKDLVRRFIAEAWNQGDVQVVDELLAPDFRETLPTATYDREGVKAFLRWFRAAFPDFRVTIDDLFAEGDRVAWRWTFRGTHQGPFMERPPTGKQVTCTGIHIFRIADGQIVEQWREVDIPYLMEQLGPIPAADP